MAHTPDPTNEEYLYRNNGCEYHHDCLSCPFERCIEEMSSAEVRAINIKRKNEELNKRLKDLHKDGNTLSQIVNVISKERGHSTLNNTYRDLKKAGITPKAHNKP